MGQHCQKESKPQPTCCKSSIRCARREAWGDLTAAHIDTDILQSALALTTYLPAVNQIYFNQGYGLNFHLPDSSTWVYWGDGLNMERKYTNIAAIQRHLRTEGTQPNITFDVHVLKN